MGELWKMLRSIGANVVLVRSQLRCGLSILFAVYRRVMGKERVMFFVR